MTMTVHVRCDGETIRRFLRGQCLTEATYADMDTADAERTATGAGWVRRGRWWFCPEHALGHATDRAGVSL